MNTLGKICAALTFDNFGSDWNKIFSGEESEIESKMNELIVSWIYCCKKECFHGWFDSSYNHHPSGRNFSMNRGLPQSFGKIKFFSLTERKKAYDWKMPLFEFLRMQVPYLLYECNHDVKNGPKISEFPITRMGGNMCAKIQSCQFCFLDALFFRAKGPGRRLAFLHVWLDFAD